MVKEIDHFYMDIEALRGRMEELGEIEDKIDEFESKLNDAVYNSNSINQRIENLQ